MKEKLYRTRHSVFGKEINEDYRPQLTFPVAAVIAIGAEVAMSASHDKGPVAMGSDYQNCTWYV